MRYVNYYILSRHPDGLSEGGGAVQLHQVYIVCQASSLYKLSMVHRKSYSKVVLMVF